MPRTKLSAIDLFRLAGYDLDREPPSAEQLEEIRELRKAENAGQAIVLLLRARREAAFAKARCDEAARAAKELDKILKSLLDAKSLLCRVEAIVPAERDSGPRRVLCRVSGAIRELPVHPGVALEEIERLRPWEYVCVHPTEHVIVGTSRVPELQALAQGEVVEFRSVVDEEHGLVQVMRSGHDEEIVTLAQELRSEELSPQTKLVLHREDSRWAIATVPGARPESRFEVPMDQIHTSFEDVAGLEQVKIPLLEDTLTRLMCPDVRDEFDLDPLRGVLLYSYAPGTGKTTVVRAFVRTLDDLGHENGFDVVLYHVRPNELKIVWHGGDAKLVREDLCGSIRARRMVPRTRPLLQVVVMDEIDSLGKRAGGDEPGNPGYISSAGNDAVQALLVEMDGIQRDTEDDGLPPANVLWIGLTNRPDLLDHALKRPGRFGDLVLEMPDLTAENAEDVLAVYAQAKSLPWLVDGEIRSGLAVKEIRRRFLRPAVNSTWDTVVMRYTTDSDRSVEVTAGQIMAGVHYEHAMRSAKRRAARRRMFGNGAPAVDVQDVRDGLLEQARDAAKQMATDRPMLRRQLGLEARVNRVELVPEMEMSAHRFLSLH